MSAASIGALRVRAAVPRGLGAPVVDRIRAAVDRPLALAVPEAFGTLEHVDDGAYWVIRDLTVHVTVPAAEPDPARHARLIAAAMARAVERVVADGPSSEAVRFAGRAEYVAAFVRGLLLGSGTGWVFERLAPFAAHPPAGALVAAARAVDVDLLGVVGALAGTRVWERLVEAARVEDLADLEAAVAVAAGPGIASSGLVAAARAARADLWAGGAVVVPGPAARRLLLLGRLASSHGVRPEVVAAVRVAEPGEGASGAGPQTALPGAGPRRAGAQGSPAWPASAGSGPPGVPLPGPAGTGAPVGAWFSSPGAAAFMLVADLDELIPRDGAAAALAARSAPAAAARAILLRGVLGPRVSAGDPALGLAAGVDDAFPADAEEGEPVESAARLVEPWLAAVRAEGDLLRPHPADAEWFEPVRALHPALADGAAALLRRFARHLPGFGHSGAGYLVERTLVPGGRVRSDDLGVEVVLPCVPLQVLLGLAGLDSFVCRPRWLSRPVTVSHEDDR